MYCGYRLPLEKGLKVNSRLTSSVVFGQKERADRLIGVSFLSGFTIGLPIFKGIFDYDIPSGG